MIRTDMCKDYMKKSCKILYRKGLLISKKDFQKTRAKDEKYNRKIGLERVQIIHKKETI